jgi:hypothetical protein
MDGPVFEHSLVYATNALHNELSGSIPLRPVALEGFDVLELTIFSENFCNGRFHMHLKRLYHKFLPRCTRRIMKENTCQVIIDLLIGSFPVVMGILNLDLAMRPVIE